MSELTDDRLLPCPGCGRNVGAPHDDEGDGIYFVDCAHCGWRGPRAYNLTDAWNRWQRRAAASTGTEGAGVIEALRTLTSAVENMRVPQNIAEAAVQVELTIGPALRSAQNVLRALNPPAPKVTTDEAEERG